MKPFSRPNFPSPLASGIFVGLIVAAIYNLVASWVGGLEVEVE